MSIAQKDETVKKRFSDNLCAAMGHRKMSQAELSRSTGESQMRISTYRRGLKMPSLAVAARLALALECSVEDLLARKIKLRT